jgi:hypothetical protein
VSRRAQLWLVVAAAAVPRLVVLLFERGAILDEFTEKSDDFARTFVESGTFGFIPGQPSAYTQPLYAFFLIPLYAIERHWLLVGLAQVAVAVATALVVRTIGERYVGPGAGTAAALAATLGPYLVWHDVHVNREVLDTLLAALVVLATLALAARPTLVRGALLGAALGAAVLGNSRLALLPLVVGGFVVWRAGRRALAPLGALAAAFVVVLAPWVGRNAVTVGCATITTDARALWKANNELTRGILAGGGWIDDVPNLEGAPITPEVAGAIYQQTGRVIELDECEQMRFYQRRVLEFWRDEPGEKALLAVQATGMLWDPRVTPRSERSPGAGTWLDTARAWVVPVYVLALFGLALAGARALPRHVLVLVVALLAYLTLTAMVFAGATRYRAPWELLLALAAAPALLRVARALDERRRRA